MTSLTDAELKFKAYNGTLNLDELRRFCSLCEAEANETDRLKRPCAWIVPAVKKDGADGGGGLASTTSFSRQAPPTKKGKGQIHSAHK